jgi:hypothetical protein
MLFLRRPGVHRPGRQQVEGQRDELLHRRLPRHQDRTCESTCPEQTSKTTFRTPGSVPPCVFQLLTAFPCLLLCPVLQHVVIIGSLGFIAIVTLLHIVGKVGACSVGLPRQNMSTSPHSSSRRLQLVALVGWPSSTLVLSGWQAVSLCLCP